MITALSIDIQKRIFDYMRGVPFEVIPPSLYNARSLYGDTGDVTRFSFDDCYDQLVYRHFIATGKHADDDLEMLARALHDYNIGKMVDDYLDHYNRCQVVGVMGGHGMLRTDQVYRDIVTLSKELTERGSLMVTGGGPGAMEATHLGAWLAGRTPDEVDEAIGMLAQAPSFTDAGWLELAFGVMNRFPQAKYRSLGIPTWLYGHEPSTPFATDIAKYFDNCIREDSILTIAFGGIIYTPGSAGTMQEIFQEAVQNHYLSFGLSSPMIFLGKQFWTEEIPVYPFIEDMVRRGKYKNLNLLLTDDPAQAVGHLLDFRCKADAGSITWG